jgi:diacylglycerol kinase (ATP)
VKLAVIINPISGTGGRPEVARQRAELAVAELTRRRLDGEVFVTERPGHASDLTRAALAAGAETVVAWGGDGTMNEVASVLAFSGRALGIVPSGSGNGLARELQIPLDARRALQVAVSGVRTRVVDAGEIDNRLFFNLAGVGLDAHVAHRFAAGGLVRRGFLRYIEIAVQELRSYTPDERVVIVDGIERRLRALMIVIANGRQYGNNATIAPHARVDDGRLDVVLVSQRSFAAALTQVPHVFRGTIDRVRGVTMLSGTDIEVISEAPVIYHLDGEPVVGGTSIRARVRPAALTVRVPEAAG